MEEADSILRSYAKKIHDRGFGIPAILLLEMHKPLVTVAHTALEAGLPLVQPALGSCFGQKLLTLLESRANVELLISYIEDCQQGDNPIEETQAEA